MHTLIVLGGGLALMVACGLLGHAFGNGMPGALKGIAVFVPLWLVLCAVNLWIGVSKAGYSLADEGPVFAGVFGALAGIAACFYWRFS